MKRYVYVPEIYLNKNKDIPEDAIRISSLSKLPIRLGENGEFPDIKYIEIICVPEKEFLSFDEKVESNFLQIINYENDFTSFDKNTQCVVKNISNNKNTIFSPTIAEKHCAKFKLRFKEKGLYSFVIVNNKIILSEEKFFEVV